RHVRLRDGTCRFPGCEVPARECDLDHLVPFPQGHTSESNLYALCRRHHGLKHDGGWQVDALPDSALQWISPQGASTLTHPDDTRLRVA
ncbi:MAG: HNH endonuclease signature motif containing protein, partial [Candidatus Nanopelagicales bacterium]